MRDDAVAHRSDPFDRCLHHVAVLQELRRRPGEADALRGAGEDDAAGPDCGKDAAGHAIALSVDPVPYACAGLALVELCVATKPSSSLAMAVRRCTAAS